MASYFAQELEANRSRGVLNKISDVRLLQGDLAEAWREGPTDYATVAMRFQLVDATVDRATGRVVEGNLNAPTEATEIWTFRRDRGGPGSSPPFSRRSDRGACIAKRPVDNRPFFLGVGWSVDRLGACVRLAGGRPSGTCRPDARRGTSYGGALICIGTSGVLAVQGPQSVENVGELNRRLRTRWEAKGWSGTRPYRRPMPTTPDTARFSCRDRAGWASTSDGCVNTRHG